MNDIILSYDNGTLLLNPGDTAITPEASRFRPRGSFWKWDRRVEAWRCAAMHYARVAAELGNRFPDRFSDTLPPRARVFHRRRPRPLPPDGAASLQAWNTAGHRGLLACDVLSERFAAAIAAMAGLPCATLVVTTGPERALAWRNRIAAGLGCEAGILGGRDRTIRPISTATYRSAHIHAPTIGALFDLLIFDEPRMLGRNTCRDIALMSIARYRLGLCRSGEERDGTETVLENLVGARIDRIESELAPERTTTTHTGVRLTDREAREYERCRRCRDDYISRRKKTNPRYTITDLRRDPCRSAASRRARAAAETARDILAGAAQKREAVAQLIRDHPGSTIAVFTTRLHAALALACRLAVPALTAATPEYERDALLAALAGGDRRAVVTTARPSRWADIPIDIAAVLDGTDTGLYRRHGAGVPEACPNLRSLHLLYCADTEEDPAGKEIWKYDAYRGRVRH